MISIIANHTLHHYIFRMKHELYVNPIVHIYDVQVMYAHVCSHVIALLYLGPRVLISPQTLNYTHTTYHAQYIPALCTPIVSYSAIIYAILVSTHTPSGLNHLN